MCQGELEPPPEHHRYIHTFAQPAANGDRWEYRTAEYQIEEN